MGLGTIGCSGGGTPGREEENDEVVEVVAAVGGRYLEDATDAASDICRTEVVRGGGFASTEAGESGRPV